ncbi:MAG: alpha/beta fold hydrolase [Zoogloeaceae bacterium]|nr:alpha/beta fold hydrolase [Zoogloeaceae bacterium]
MKTLAFIAGWGFDSRIWQPVVERLSGDFRISDGLAPLPVDAIVCGWSLGAMRALRLASEAPARIGKLILVAATPRFVQAPDWPCAQPPELLAGFSAAVAADPQAALRRFAALMNQGDSQARDITRHMQALWRERIPDEATLAAGLAELGNTDLRNSAAAISLPTLLIHGERDPLVPPAAGRWLAQHLPAAKFESFADAAHAPFIADPNRFVDLIREFCP